MRLGVEVAGPELGAVRIDSGDLGLLAEQVRAQLDQLGAHDTRIVVTSDLDEHAIAALASAPVDGYGVGTQLVTGSGHPTSGFVYKLVARENDDGVLQSVAKKSVDKISIGGRKYALRRRDAAGVAEAEVIGIGTPAENDGDDRELLVPLVRDGRGGRPRAARRRPGPARRGPRRAAAGRPADVPRRTGDPDHLRGGQP